MSWTTPWLSCMAPCSAARPGVSIFGRPVPPCETAHAGAVAARPRQPLWGRPPAAAAAAGSVRTDPGSARHVRPDRAPDARAVRRIRGGPEAVRAKWTSRREVVEYFLVARHSTAQAGRPDSAPGPGRATVSAAAPAPLAQLAEQLTLNQWVLGSSPRGRTTAEALPRQHAAGPLVVSGTDCSAPLRPWDASRRRRPPRAGPGTTVPGVTAVPRASSAGPCPRGPTRGGAEAASRRLPAGAAGGADRLREWCRPGPRSRAPLRRPPRSPGRPGTRRRNRRR